MIEKEIVIDMKEIIDDIKEKVNNDRKVILKGEGVSMSPFITDKDTLVLNKLPSKIKIGEVYLYGRIGGGYALHRVYAVKKDLVLMLGDAQLYIEKVDKCRLIAKVVSVEKPNEIINCNSFFVRAKCAFRMKNRIYKIKIKSFFKKIFVKLLGLLSRVKRKIIKKDK